MIFDEHFRRRLEVLKRLVARALAGRGGGMGRSPLRARGGRVEFGGHRAYAPGDDVQAIDWNAYARLEALVVKEFEAPREGHLLLVLDRSGSMRMLGKEEAALRAAAALGWLGLAAGARVACAGGGAASRWVGGKERFPELLEALEKLPAGGAADLPGAVERAPAPGAGRRTAVLFSDLYEAGPAARALQALSRRGGAAVCVHVLAPEELRAPEGAAAVLRDAESGEALPVRLSPESRERYARAAERFCEERRALAVRHGARYLRLAPGDDLVLAVERVLGSAA